MVIKKVVKNFEKNSVIFEVHPKKVEVYAAPLLENVFYNLVDNALRYGKKITTIWFSVKDGGGEAVIICGDDGIGVPPGEKERIFERGFGKHTGISFFLSHEILRITGISVRETGEHGRGAQFEI